MNSESKLHIMKKSIISFILTFSFLQIVAQDNYLKGFIINIDGDTIKGFVNYLGNKKNSQFCLFKHSDSVPPEKFLPGEINSYGFLNSKYFVSIQLPGNQNREVLGFAECLVRGRVSLYLYTEKSEKGHYYVEKNDTVKELKTIKVQKEGGFYKYQEYKGILFVYLKESEKSLSAIPNTRLVRSDLIKLIHNYNLEVEPENLIFVSKINSKIKRKKWIRIKPGVQLGYFSSKLSFDEKNSPFIKNNSVNTYNNYSGRFRLQLLFPYISKKISINTGLHFTKFYFEGEYHPYYSSKSFKIELENINVPIWLQYTVLNKNVSPYLSFGFIVGHNLLDNVETLNNFFFQKYDVSYSIYKQVRNNGSGILLAVGLNYRLINKIETSFEIMYEYANGYLLFSKSICEPRIYYEVHAARVHTLNFLVGIKF